MIAGVNLFTYLEADSNRQPWTLKFCLDLEAKLMMALSKRLRGASMEFIDPNNLPEGPLLHQLIDDIDLDFEYTARLHNVVFRMHFRATLGAHSLLTTYIYRRLGCASQGNSFGCDRVGSHLQSRKRER